MALKKCEKCGKFFGQEGDGTLCYECRNPQGKKAILTGDIEHDKFTNARAAVYDSPHLTPKELVEELKNRGIDITLKEILNYVSEGRLTLVTIEGGTYCSSCGRKIMIGTMCSDCSDKLEKFRKPAAQPTKQPEEKKKGGMHTKK